MIARFLSLGLLSGIFLLTSCGDSDRKKAAEQQKGAPAQTPASKGEAITVSTSTLFDNIEIPGSLLQMKLQKYVLKFQG